MTNEAEHFLLVEVLTMDREQDASGIAQFGQRTAAVIRTAWMAGLLRRMVARLRRRPVHHIAAWWPIRWASSVALVLLLFHTRALQIVWASPDSCAAPPNPVVAENCLPGTTDWQLENYSHDIGGFASATSVNVGEVIDFFVNTTAPQYELRIYRSGYYGGTGGRLIKAIQNLPGQTQPACYQDYARGLTSCSNWSLSYHLTIPGDWVSGIYIVKLIRPDTGGSNHIYFVVRDDARRSDILYQQSVTTFQAYNNYGGKSLYDFNSSDCPAVSTTKRAVAVSFQRPYADLSKTQQNMYLHVEYPLVRWLEAQGYDVTYSTNLDTHHSGQPGVENQLLKHRVFVSSGHDEYWTQAMRDAITAARDAGVHLAFFSSNVGYWRIRLEADPWTKEPESVVVSYKTSEAGPTDPTGFPTTTWRDPAGANDPENSLVGIQYIGDHDAYYFPLRVTSEMASDRIYRHTGLQDMPAGTYVDLGHRIVGWEWDAVVDNGHTPPGLTILAATPVFGEVLLDAGRNYDVRQAVAHTTRYVATSGAIVFATGTNQWSWGLELIDPDPRIQQITYNVFSDMGVQPASPAPTLVLDSAAASGEVSEPEAAFQSLRAGAGPTLSNISVTVTDREATITWETDVDTDGQIWFSETFGEGAHNIYPMFSNSFSRKHVVLIPGLMRDRVYYYRVISSAAPGQVNVSALSSFRTQRGTPIAQVRGFLRWNVYMKIVPPLMCCWQAHPVLGWALAGVLALMVGWTAWRFVRGKVSARRSQRPRS